MRHLAGEVRSRDRPSCRCWQRAEGLSYRWRGHERR